MLQTLNDSQLTANPPSRTEEPADVANGPDQPVLVETGHAGAATCQTENLVQDDQRAPAQSKLPSDEQAQEAAAGVSAPRTGETLGHRAKGSQEESAGPASGPATVQDAAPEKPRRRRHAVPVMCAGLAIAAAFVALAAPGLRPGAAELSAGWLGTDSKLTRLLAPPERPNSEGELALVLTRLAALEASTRLLGAGLRNVDTRLSETSTIVQDASRVAATAAAQASDALRRANSATEAERALALDTRAIALLAITTKLRRDIDAGASLTDAVSLLVHYAPFPPPAAQAVEEVAALQDGVPAMRDLALGFEALDARIKASAESQAAWSPLAWLRMRPSSSLDAMSAPTLERLRVLAGDGRFSEAAALMERSPWKELGAAWTDQVRDRTRAVRAIQTLTAYAIGEARQSGPDRTSRLNALQREVGQ